MRGLDDLSALREWISLALGTEVDLLAAERLPGATSSTLYRVRVHVGGEPMGLVLRLFTNQEWLRDEPDLVTHEAASLTKASRVGIPTPRLVAVDEDGSSLGAPAVLMTELAGRVELAPYDQGRRLAAMAAALAQVHQLEASEFGWRYRTYNDLTALEVPYWSDRRAEWGRAIRLAQGLPPASRRSFIHRDFHPCNVLWREGRLSGIVDWVNACEGPVGIDVGHCRLNLALLQGVESADAFLRDYQAAAGRAFDYHPYWDLVSLLEFLPGPPMVYRGWVDFGVTGLTDGLMAERLEAYLLSLLRRW